ncbi:MAG: hypothetical protein QOE66_1085 [Chloroflexota bacterium]|nr:hypothetical protein [Chloroflexota bacterium]
MPRRPAWSTTALTFALAFAGAAAVALYIIRPIHVAAVDFDSAASVIYFERIVGGHRLEALVGATPKPLLTVIFGVLHAIVPDWRPIIWASIGAYATAIGLAAVLARRLARIAAAAFVAVALIGSTEWLLDVARGYGVAWAMLGWVVAGLAVTADKPRYGLVTIALFLATLARLEGFVVIGIAIAGLFIWTVRARSGRISAPPRRAWLMVAALLALPVMFLHDWLLTGDPTFWLQVSARFSKGAAAAVAAQGPLTIARWLVVRFVDMGAFAVLAAVGLALLISARRWVAALGLLAATAGIGGFLVLLAARGTFVSTRYAIAIDVFVLFAAGLGFAALRIPSLTWPNRLNLKGRALELEGERWRTWPVVFVAIVCAAILSISLDTGTGDVRQIKAEQLAAKRSDMVVPIIRRALAGVPGGGGYPGTSSALPPAGADQIVLLVPSPLRPRLAVDDRVSLARISAIGSTAFGTPESLLGVPGRIIVHDPRLEGSAAAAFTALESPDPVIAGVHLVPLLLDPVQRLWVYQVPLTTP